MLLLLGEFSFSIYGDNIHAFDGAAEARLAPQELINRAPIVQSLGPAAAHIALQGIIRPEYQGGLGQINDLLNAAGDGAPRVLTTGYGAYFGLF